MKHLATLLIIIFYSIILKAQQNFEHSATFPDGLKIDYSVLINNPYTYTNLTVDFGFEFNTLTNVPNELAIALDINYLFPKIGEVNFFLSRGIFSSFASPTFTRSDNVEVPYTKIGGGITIDAFFNKLFIKGKKLLLKSVGFGRIKTNYVANYDFVLNRKIGVDIGFFRTYSTISNFQRKDEASKWFLTSEQGDIIIPGDNDQLNSLESPDYEDQGANVHTTIVVDMLYFGASFETTHRIRVATSEKKKPHEVGNKWGCFAHFIYAPSIKIDPVVFYTSKDIILDYTTGTPTYIATIPRGSYNVQHSNPGSFKTVPWGFRLGAFTRLTFNRTIGVTLKLEAGMLPGVDSYTRGGLFSDFGRVYLSASMMMSLGFPVPKFPDNYKL